MSINEFIDGPSMNIIDGYPSMNSFIDGPSMIIIDGPSMNMVPFLWFPFFGPFFGAFLLGPSAFRGGWRPTSGEAGDRQKGGCGGLQAPQNMFAFKPLSAD